MEGLRPYLTFNGNCEEALNFYKEKLKGEITLIMHFDEAPMEIPEEYKKKVMHSVFVFGNNGFMASDAYPGTPSTVGDNISLSIGTTDLQKTEELFNNLAEGGKVTMELQDTFWGARFGTLTDKFGIHWMFNCEMAKKS